MYDAHARVHGRTRARARTHGRANKSRQMSGSSAEEQLSSISSVPFAEPAYMQGFHSPYFKETRGSETGEWPGAAERLLEGASAVRISGDVSVRGDSGVLDTTTSPI